MITDMGERTSRARAVASGRSPDVLVIGGGNAALCAALAARDLGADVLLLERAPQPWRGGNSKYTRNLRCVHDADPLMPGVYTEEELRSDLAGVTGEGTDRRLTEIAIVRSREAPAWMEAHGIRWQPAIAGTLQLARTNRFFLGGGKALVNAYFARAHECGVRVEYSSCVRGVETEGDRCVGVTVEREGRIDHLVPRAVVAAAGGFEANLDWLGEYWGDGARNYRVRGSRHNDGTVLRCLLRAGALARGNPRGFHAVAVDDRGPRFEGGIVTRIDSVPFGIVVNREGRRFYDEGEELWPKRYASWGALIAQQPGQIAYSIFDSRVRDRFMTTAFPPLEAPTVGALAQAIAVPADALEETIGAYNAAVRPGTYDTTTLDDCAAPELEPPKSHWALRIEAPPFFAYPLRTGVTFTYLGVGAEETTRIRRAQGGVFGNLFAAGEIMAGNILRRGYLAGFGMTIGTVFGRIAGEEAASVG
jgi:tricarballylate dehydrogenase